LGAREKGSLIRLIFDFSVRPSGQIAVSLVRFSLIIFMTILKEVSSSPTNQITFDEFFSLTVEDNTIYKRTPQCLHDGTFIPLTLLIRFALF
jgi:hypothetical protein